MHLKNQLHEASKSLCYSSIFLLSCADTVKLGSRIVLHFSTTWKGAADVSARDSEAHCFFATGGSRRCCTGEYILIHFHTLLCSRMVCVGVSQNELLCVRAHCDEGTCQTRESHHWCVFQRRWSRTAPWDPPPSYEDVTLWLFCTLYFIKGFC